MQTVRRKLIKVFSALGLVALFAVGYAGVSAVTSCEAKAQVCCNSLCMGWEEGLGRALADVWLPDVPISALYAAASITVYYGAEMAEFSIKMLQQINLNIAHWVSWWDTLWFYGLNPALQDMARQLTVLDIDQARMIASFNDMVDRSNALAERAAREAESRQRHSPSEGVCSAGTISVGLGRLDDLSSAYFSASLREVYARGAGAPGTPAAAGPAASLAHDMRNHRDLYCFKGEDGGAGCGDQDAPFAGKDRDVAGLLETETLDLKQPDVQGYVTALVANLTDPIPAEKPSSSVITSAKGQEAILAREEEKAGRSVAQAAVLLPVADRAPAGEATFVDEIRTAAGLPPTPATGASEKETMDALANQRAKALGVTQATLPPDKLVHEQVVNTGILLRQNMRLLEAYQRLALVTAGQVGLQVRKSYDATGSVGGAR